MAHLADNIIIKPEAEDQAFQIGLEDSRAMREADMTDFGRDLRPVLEYAAGRKLPQPAIDIFLGHKKLSAVGEHLNRKHDAEQFDACGFRKTSNKEIEDTGRIREWGGKHSRTQRREWTSVFKKAGLITVYAPYLPEKEQREKYFRTEMAAYAKAREKLQAMPKVKGKTPKWPDARGFEVLPNNVRQLVPHQLETETAQNWQQLRRLTKEQTLQKHGKKLSAYLLGLPYSVTDITDRRVLRKVYPMDKVLKRLITVFRPTEILNPQYRVKSFTKLGWFATPWNGLKTLFGMSEKEIRPVLDVLRAQGILEWYRAPNSGKNQPRIFIRFRADRVFGKLNELNDLEASGMLVAPLNPGKITSARKSTSIYFLYVRKVVISQSEGIVLNQPILFPGTGIYLKGASAAQQHIENNPPVPNNPAMHAGCVNLVALRQIKAKLQVPAIDEGDAYTRKVTKAFYSLFDCFGNEEDAIYDPGICYKSYAQVAKIHALIHTGNQLRKMTVARISQLRYLRDGEKYDPYVGSRHLLKESSMEALDYSPGRKWSLTPEREEFTWQDFYGGFHRLDTNDPEELIRSWELYVIHIQHESLLKEGAVAAGMSVRFPEVRKDGEVVLSEVSGFASRQRRAVQEFNLGVAEFHETIMHGEHYSPYFHNNPLQALIAYDQLGRQDDVRNLIKQEGSDTFYQAMRCNPLAALQTMEACPGTFELLNVKPLDRRALLQRAVVNHHKYMILQTRAEIWSLV